MIVEGRITDESIKSKLIVDEYGLFRDKNFCDTCCHQYSDICGGCETLEGVPIKYDNKPPIGIVPRYIHNSNRTVKILDAMERYSKASRSIPVEWIDELRDLINELIGGKDA